MANLIEALRFLPRHYGRLARAEAHLLPDDYYSPGFITVLASYLNHKGVRQDSVAYASEENRGYLAAVGLSKALWGVDDYKFERKNAGINYSPLTPLASQDAVDLATEQINDCLRAYAKQGNVDYSNSPAFRDLMRVVGELHDNVWSHGLSTGYSMAQRQAFGKSGDHVIEFSLADCGLGFLGELKSSGMRNIESHEDAIKWCIQEGNSSKKAQAVDDWAQSVPNDFVGESPFGAVPIRAAGNGNHHQGLGLAKLVELAKKYQGVLHLASGNCALRMSHHGVMTYQALQAPWKGVAVSLTIKESSFMSAKAAEADDADNVDDIMKLLRG
ncbi:hypothetical protein F2A37_10170 [Pseudomonas chlororaphis]|uniref:hypothetical protein n=1 Tax=Pseudomonas chlororaphis TaxID=587753 RepID=UPI001231CF3E|nr:hypothetical protein [Pseudomonas chlororaphis]KAA5845942.1 hypothetical protein F2A37_10170 [Pseudomonas chlororaphis]